MGDITLGAVMGRNHSFESFTDFPEYWGGVSNQASYYQVNSATSVHSSSLGLETFADSTGGDAGILRYSYDDVSEYYRVAFPEISSHQIKSFIWARAGDAPSSGQTRWVLAGNSEATSQPIAFHSTLNRYEAETFIDSQASLPFAGLVRIFSTNSQATVFLDDAVTQVDPQILRPEWTLGEMEKLTEIVHRTRNGDLKSYRWNSYFDIAVPLRWISTEQADLINWWWENQLDLVLILDSSDPAAMILCRIGNESQPIGQREPPYTDHWKGRLHLEGINQGGLIY
jgi:hypothetical protein